MRIRRRATRELVDTSAERAPFLRAGIHHTSVKQMRVLARAPRLLAVAVAVVLVLAGLRTVVFGAPAPQIQRVYEPTSDNIGTEAFAEDFARAYLTWNGSGDTQAYGQSLALYNPQFTDSEGVQPPNAPERVSWASVVQDQPSALKGSRIVTVELQLDPGNRTCYLAVPVNRAQDGALSVTT
jgi:hypothetical protein